MRGQSLSGAIELKKGTPLRHKRIVFWFESEQDANYHMLLIRRIYPLLRNLIG